MPKQKGSTVMIIDRYVDPVTGVRTYLTTGVGSQGDIDICLECDNRNDKYNPDGKCIYDLPKGIRRRVSCAYREMY